MPALTLKNITIKKLMDKNLNPYYLIVNNDIQEEVYFCFEQTVKSGWNSLINNWQQSQEIEIEYSESRQNDKIFRKVTSFWTPNQEEFLI